MPLGVFLKIKNPVYELDEGNQAAADEIASSQSANLAAFSHYTNLCWSKARFIVRKQTIY